MRVYRFTYIIILLAPMLTNAQERERYVSREDVRAEISPETIDTPKNPFPVGDDHFNGSAFLQGIAMPWQDGNLTVTDPSVVTKIHLQEGELVTSGDAIVSLDSRIAEAAVAVAQREVDSRGAMEQAELAMKSAQSILIRTETAYRSGASGGFELEAKKNEFEQAAALYDAQVEAHLKARAELKLAEAELATKTLRAPFDGMVVQIPAKLGNSLQPSDIAARVVELRKLRVEMHLPTTLFGRIQKGQKVTLRGGPPVGRDVEGNVLYVSPVVEPTSSTFRATFVIDNQNLELPAGFEVYLKSAPKKAR